MLLEGKSHQDERGIITYNNDFDLSQIKRIYTIENHSTDFIRGWQGHKIEQRWFACMKGSFEISVIIVDDFIYPSRKVTIQKYLLKDDVLTYLHIPSGCITAIQAKEENSKLLVLADYSLGEINDEYRYSLDYFKTIQ
ncbi:WxcM-like domain-containing protein [Chryseobacterium sp. GMJ5]|uniref:WxcM-like domain-containing protein n=1 Tax=Chryseobacterium gilvum TaxID=2976534 RepID=A0ABT2VYK5_9FLAO|nr:WxcM-like domain-containing protein [Chryseobacterium gilvum]MCU7615084.1 WxcM-like domain-containing protein [Chryseobacterium gilvum]